MVRSEQIKSIVRKAPKNLLSSSPNIYDVGCCVSQVGYFPKAITRIIGIHFRCIIYRFEAYNEINKTLLKLFYPVVKPKILLLSCCYLVLRFYSVFPYSSRIFISFFFLELGFECHLFSFYFDQQNLIIILYFIFEYFGKFAIFRLVIKKGLKNPSLFIQTFNKISHYSET